MGDGLLAGLALALASIVFIFWPERNPFVQRIRRGSIPCSSARMRSMRICAT